VALLAIFYITCYTNETGLGRIMSIQ
jgi:hypothetical protein